MFEPLSERVAHWVHQSDLLELLRVDVAQLSLTIFRLRQQFDEARIVPAARIVERRAGTRQLRVGVGRVEVRGLDGG